MMAPWAMGFKLGSDPPPPKISTLPEPSGASFFSYAAPCGASSFDEHGPANRDYLGGLCVTCLFFLERRLQLLQFIASARSPLPLRIPLPAHVFAVYHHIPMQVPSLSACETDDSPGSGPYVSPPITPSSGRNNLKPVSPVTPSSPERFREQRNPRVGPVMLMRPMAPPPLGTSADSSPTVVCFVHILSR